MRPRPVSGHDDPPARRGLPRGRSATGVLTAGLGAVLATGALTWPAAGTAAPAGSAAERVSPIDTGRVPPLNALDGSSAGLVLGDDTVVFSPGLAPLADSPSGYGQTYAGRRTTSGWTTTPLGGPATDFDRGYVPLDATPDLTGTVFNVQNAVAIGFPPPGNNAPPRLVHRDAAGVFRTITQNVGFDYESSFGALVDGGRGVVFSTINPPADATGVPEGRSAVYRWSVPGTRVRVAGEAGSPLEDCGSDVPGGLVLGNFGTPGGAAGSTPRGMVSTDGSTTFVQSLRGGAACPDNTQVFAEIEGATVRVSRSTDGTVVPASARAALFQGAAPDGRTAYFTSAAAYAATDTNTQNDLYRWRRGATGTEVTCVTCSGTGRVSGPARVARGSDTVLFRATGPVQGVGPANGGVFALRGDTVSFVPEIAAVGGLSVGGLSKDGSTVVGPDAQNRLWRVPIGGDATCLTCDPRGDALPILGLVAGFNAESFRDVGSVSDDGATVAFTDTAAVTPDAPVEGRKAYRWRAGTGVELLAADVEDAGAGLSPSGATTFVVSRQPLTGDVPTSGVGLYALRDGGGFPGPAPTPDPCAGDACQGAATPPSSSPSPTSAVDRPGSQATPPPETPTPPKLRALRVRATSSGVRLSLRAPGAGKLTVRGSGVRTVTRRTTRSATYVVRARLTAAGARTLRRTGRLRVRVRTTFTPKAGRAQTTTTTTTVRRAGR